MRRKDGDGTQVSVKQEHSTDSTRHHPHSGEQMIEVVSAAAKEFLAKSDWRQCVPPTLERLGRCGELSRTSLHKISTDGDTILSQQRCSWHASGSAGDSQRDGRIRSLQECGLDRYGEQLAAGEVVTSELKHGDEDGRRQPGVLGAAAVAPIFCGSRWWGYLQLDPLDHGNTWSASELMMFKATADIIGAAIYRQENEEELRDSEERLRRLSNAADEGIVIHDNGVIVDLNDAFARIFGYQREELISTNLRRLATPESWRIIERHIAEGYEKPYEGVGIDKDGSTVLCQVIGKPCRHQGRQLRAAAVRDVTRQKRTERELVMQKIRFEQLFENTPLAILMGDDEDRVVSVNSAFRNLFGFSRKDVVGRFINDLITPEGLKAEASSISEKVLAGDTARCQTTRRHKDGSLIEVEIYGVPVVLDTKAVGVYGIYVDQSERRLAEQALRESEERFRSLAEQSLQGIFVFTRGKVVYTNRMMSQICGYSGEELLRWGPKGLGKIVHPSDRNVVAEVLRSIDDGNTRTTPQIECRITTSEGRLKWVMLQARAINFEGEPAAQGLIVDITKRKLAEEQLQHSTLYDALTGLPNRALFYDRVEMAIERAKVESNVSFAVMAFDLDRFQVINDSLGHLLGDQLLMETARRLEQVVRPGDTVARLGGDEFAIHVNDMRNATEAGVVAERIQKALAAPFVLGQEEVFSTASIGISLSTGGYSSPDEIFRDADIALSRAKELGRARHEVFNPEMRTSAVSLQRLESDLRRAVERNEFTLYYQPIVSLRSQQIIAFEALLRWQHPQRGLISPGEFLPLAEETGLIIPIGEWVLNQACQQIRGWERFCNGCPAPAVCVNLFSRQFSQPELVGLIEEVLQATGAKASSLHLEITESAVIDDPERAIHVLKQLKGLDLKINLDDFGTGYSSFSYLQRFAVDVLKIDQSFVAKIGTGGGKGTEIVEAIVTLAHKLGMEALGEGIETAEQLNRLAELDCEYGQGYYFSSALDKTEATKLLQSQETRYLR